MWAKSHWYGESDAWTEHLLRLLGGIVFQCVLHAFKVWFFFAASSVKLVPVSGSASAATAASAALGLSYVRVLRC